MRVRKGSITSIGSDQEMRNVACNSHAASITLHVLFMQFYDKSGAQDLLVISKKEKGQIKHRVRVLCITERHPKFSS